MPTWVPTWVFLGVGVGSSDTHGDAQGAPKPHVGVFGHPSKTLPRRFQNLKKAEFINHCIEEYTCSREFAKNNVRKNQDVIETAAAGPLLWRCRCGAAVVGLQWDCCGTAVRVAVGHVQAVATLLAERSPAILGFLRASAVELVPGGCCRKGAAGRLLLGGCCCEAAAGRLLETAARAQYA